MKRPVAELKRALRRLIESRAEGRQNAIPLAAIGTELDLSWREVAELIEALRAEGILIGTARGKPSGAFWPKSPQDQEDALLPYAKAFYRMSQIYNRLCKVARRAIIEAVEQRVQRELFQEGGRWP